MQWAGYPGLHPMYCFCMFASKLLFNLFFCQNVFFIFIINEDNLKLQVIQVHLLKYEYMNCVVQ